MLHLPANCLIHFCRHTYSGSETAVYDLWLIIQSVYSRSLDSDKTRWFENWGVKRPFNYTFFVGSNDQLMDAIFVFVNERKWLICRLKT
ncbi:hypothetical protein PRUPE_8G187700 [Prunus persica]|uniref:Uncharacterized protein n=1 Tax=Prunus persica TaxID=3760 RepID=A0A251N003_PRUPE|nr:hypothetical protein PRUPE_8G187700 [Prunus persica]